MTDSLGARLVAGLRDEAYRRAKGDWGWRLRAAFAPWVARIDDHRLDRGRYSRAGIMTAVSEAAEGFAPEDVARFDRTGEVPEWFWPWVEARATFWDRTT